MRMDHGDVYLAALQDFAKADEKQLTPELVDVLEAIAKTGKCLYAWDVLKPFLVFTLDEVTKDFLNSYDVKDEIESLESTRTSLVASFSDFASAPFTLQRLAELLADPKKHYKTPSKYFRGLEKNILVVSTINVEPACMKSLKRQRETISAHRQNGNMAACSPRKVRRVDSAGHPIGFHHNPEAMVIDDAVSSSSSSTSEAGSSTMDSTCHQDDKQTTNNDTMSAGSADDMINEPSSSTENNTMDDAAETQAEMHPSDTTTPTSTDEDTAASENCNGEGDMEEG